jgi:hypothetical protein
MDLAFHSVQDSAPPALLERGADCAPTVDVSFEEPTGPYYGIAAFDILDTTNARVTVQPGANSLPTGRVTVSLSAIDMFSDMTYAVSLTDLAGNSITYRDTIAGYTVAAYSPRSGERLSERIGGPWQADSLSFLFGRCDTILLTNYGFRPVSVSSISVLHNREFSVPPSQLPIRITPGDTVKMAVCLEGRFAGIQSDTLVLYDSCGRAERIAVRSPVDYGYGTGADNCGQSISIQAYAPAKRTFLSTPVPNPSHGGAIRVDIGLPDTVSVSLDVLDANGHHVLRILDKQRLVAGVHRLNFVGSRLSSGLYFCRLTSSAGSVKTTKLLMAE